MSIEQAENQTIIWFVWASTNAGNPKQGLPSKNQNLYTGMQIFCAYLCVTTVDIMTAKELLKNAFVMTYVA